MKTKWTAAGAAIVVLAGGVWAAARGNSAASAGTDAVSRQGVELTVYREDFGMVRETRPVRLTAGENSVQLLEISKQLDPQSVLLRWQGEQKDAPELVAHSYDLGVSNADGLLKRYLGREVELVRYGQNGQVASRDRGKLMVEAGGDTVIQKEDRFLIHPQGEIVAPARSEVVTIPRLSVQAISKGASSNGLELAYLTRGLFWNADYVATLDPQTDQLKLECWATVTNRTGADYPAAKVTLMSGSPNRATEPASERMAATSVDASGDWFKGRGHNWHFADGHTKGIPLAGAGAIAAPEAVGDMHAYRITNPSTVVQERMNRLLMIQADAVHVKKDYSARLPELYGWDDWGARSVPRRGTAQLAFSFFNKEKEGLGQPLPAGALRVYEPDKSGSLRYAGAASIIDTPKEQKVAGTLSNVFDVFTETRVVSVKKIDKRTIRKEIEVVLHNEKAAPVDLRLVQSLPGRWKMVTESHKRVNLDAYTAQWTIPVPAGGTTTLKYAVDLSV